MAKRAPAMTARWNSQCPAPGAASRLVAILLLSIVTACATAANVLTGPKVTVEQGELLGKHLENGGALYAGIPYAAPPLGDLRWRPPISAPGWQGIRDATEYGATCPQPDMGWNSKDYARQDEDCLTLNVWVPQSATANMPVMVWFHGGGFIGGAGSNPTYDGSALMDHGVVLVTVNYRLGVLGFLAHPDLSAESADHVSGNYGIMDQIAALEWVNQNIENFGGDPDNVTAFGQSAGSFSTATLATVPEARRNFQRVILQSGVPFADVEYPTLSTAETVNAEFGEIDELRAMPAGELISRWSSYAAENPSDRATMPIMDGRVLKTPLPDAYLNGAVRDLPLLVGSNVREIAPADDQQLESVAAGFFGPDKASETLEFYRQQGTDASAGDPGTQFMTDIRFRCGTILTARSSDTSWLYHFFEAIPSRPAPAHSSEVPYVFSTPSSLSRGPRIEFNESEQALSDVMATYWTNFARNGDPNSPEVPEWPSFSSGEAFAELKTEGVAIGHELRTAHCAPFIQNWSAQ